MPTKEIWLDRVYLKGRAKAAAAVSAKVGKKMTNLLAIGPDLVYLLARLMLDGDVAATRPVAPQPGLRNLGELPGLSEPAATELFKIATLCRRVGGSGAEQREKIRNCCDRHWNNVVIKEDEVSSSATAELEK